MTFLVGRDWIELFDVVITHARKPKFFYDTARYAFLLSVCSLFGKLAAVAVTFHRPKNNKTCFFFEKERSVEVMVN
jgi:hypothetical protein